MINDEHIDLNKLVFEYFPDIPLHEFDEEDFPIILDSSNYFIINYINDSISFIKK
jgi:hypothetical protein